MGALVRSRKKASSRGAYSDMQEGRRSGVACRWRAQASVRSYARRGSTGRHCRRPSPTVAHQATGSSDRGHARNSGPFLRRIRQILEAEKPRSSLPSRAQEVKGFRARARVAGHSLAGRAARNRSGIVRFVGVGGHRAGASRLAARTGRARARGQAGPAGGGDDRMAPQGQRPREHLSLAQAETRQAKPSDSIVSEAFLSPS